MSFMDWADWLTPDKGNSVAIVTETSARDVTQNCSKFNEIITLYCVKLHNVLMMIKIEELAATRLTNTIETFRFDP